MIQKKELPYQGFKPINWQLWATSGLMLLTMQPAWAEMKARGSGEVDEGMSGCVKSPSSHPPIHPIFRVRDLKRPATTVKDWLAQVEATTVQVTGVKLERTDAELEITLETAESKPLQVDATKFRTDGNNLIADIPNVVLALPDAQGFSADNPTGDIANVQVIQLDANNIRITVVGRGALPTTEVTLRTGAFAYSLNPEGETPEEELVVTGEQDGYTVPEASTATLTDTPLRDIPQSIQVVPQQVIKDQGITRIVDAVRNVSGTQIGGGYGNLFGEVRIRGFGAGQLVDGFTGLLPVNGANIEQVEILKGPASVLYGEGDPGGLVNYVTKKPLSNPYYFASFTAGSYDYYNPAIDLSGPLTTDKRLLYRLNVSYENSGSYRDYIENNILYISGS